MSTSPLNKETFTTTCHQLDPHFRNKKHLIAVSGGIDSMVLVDLMLQSSMNFGLIHVNYNLRAEASVEDQKFIEDFAKKHQRSLYVKNTTELSNYKEGKSIQNEARNIRYDFFNKIMHEQGYDFLLTAHHLDDKIETSIYNFVKGSGLKGISSIKGKRDHIVRPLLRFSRHDIEMYAKQEKITWREDQSNKSLKYKRNYLRHVVIPSLKTITIDVQKTIGLTMNNVQDAHLLIESFVEDYLKKNVTYYPTYKEINLKEILDYKGLRTALYYILNPLSLNETQLTNLLDLIGNNNPGLIKSNDFVIEYSRHKLFVETKKVGLDNDIYVDLSNIPFNTSLNDTQIEFSTDSENLDILITSKGKQTQFSLKNYEDHLPLKIGKRQKGKTEYIITNIGRKSIKKVYTDCKLSQTEKSNTYIIYNNDNRILMIIGLMHSKELIQL